MRCVRLTSSSPHLLTLTLLTLFLLPSATAAQPNSTAIRIWTVGSPHTNELPRAIVPPSLRQRAESLGYTIEIEAFRARGFAAKFHEALQSHTEPEILTFDNYGVLSGMQTTTGWVEGIDWNRRTASTLALVHETMTSLQQRGWVMLVRTAVNYEGARALSMRPPQCEVPVVRAMDSPATSETLRDAQDKALSAARAYLDCDRATLSATADKSRLVQQCFLPQSTTKIESVKACNVLGNQKLAFVTLVSGFSAEVRDPQATIGSLQGMDLGQRSILTVLTNQDGTWRVLAITHDPVNTWAWVRTALTTNTLVNKLENGSPTGITTDPAQLLTPNGAYPLPPRGERFGDFTWQPSQGSEVIGQIVEFMWGKEKNWGLTRLFFLPPGENKLSSGWLMSGGPQVWRVWSITKTGEVIFSEQHFFKH